MWVYVDSSRVVGLITTGVEGLFGQPLGKAGGVGMYKSGCRSGCGDEGRFGV